jgi:hypothetical protein
MSTHIVRYQINGTTDWLCLSHRQIHLEKNIYKFTKEKNILGNTKKTVPLI